MDKDLFIAFSGMVVGAFLGPLIIDAVSKRKQRSQAAAALRFELASNLLWIDSIVDTLNYLRDEAWVAMKNNGYISYLRSPLPMKVAQVYNSMHALNGLIKKLRESKEEDKKSLIEKVIATRDQYRTECIDLIQVFDKKHYFIGRNFR